MKLRQTFAPTLLLTLLYALTLGSLHPWDLAFGAALSAASLALSRRWVFWREEGELGARGLRRFALFFPLAAALFLEITRSTIDVALRALGVRPVHRPGIVRVPFEERTMQGVAITSLLVSVPPGSVLLDVDSDRREMVFHVIDASDPDRVLRSLRTFYVQRQRTLFP